MTPAIQSALTRMNLNPAYASIITTLIFTSLHNTDLYSIFYLGNRFEKLAASHNGSLWSGISAHALNNIVNTIIFRTTVENIDKEIERIKIMNNDLRKERIDSLIGQSKQILDELNQKILSENPDVDNKQKTPGLSC